MKKLVTAIIIFLMAISLPALSSASLMFSDGSGLSATADFILNPDGYDLGIVLTNTSTAIPSGFDNSDALLTSLSFDLGSNSILGGQAFITAGSNAISFAIPPYVPGPLSGTLDVSPEWGYGNTGTTDLLDNFVSANNSHTTKFAPGNLDGPSELAGPQGGLSNDAYDAVFPPSLNPLGRINNSVTFWLYLDEELLDLNFLNNGAIVEFGSDMAFLSPRTPIPEPPTMLLLGIGLIGFSVVSRKKFLKK
jgi:hypothetical protein